MAEKERVKPRPVRVAPRLVVRPEVNDEAFVAGLVVILRGGQARRARPTADEAAGSAASPAAKTGKGEPCVKPECPGDC